MESSSSFTNDFAQELLSSLNRTEILKQLIQRLIKEFDVKRGSFWAVEGNKVIPIFSLGKDGLGGEINTFVAGSLKLGDGFVGLAAKTGKPNLCNNPHASPLFNPKFDAVANHGTRNLISIPLNKGSLTIGVIQLLDRKRPFTQEDQDRLVHNYAPWATIALDNANLYEQAQKITSFGQQLLSSLDRRRVLKQLLERLIVEFSAARGSVWSIENDFLVPIFSLDAYGNEDEISQALSEPVPIGKGYVGHAAKTGLPNHSNDPQFSDMFNPKFDRITGRSTRNIISIPLNRENVTIGVIQLLNRDYPFTNEDELLLLEQYAPWATIALDNANLYKELDDLSSYTIHHMGNVLGDARTKLYFLEEELKAFIAQANNTLGDIETSVTQKLGGVDENLSQYINNIQAMLKSKEVRGEIKKSTSALSQIIRLVLITMDIDSSIQVDVKVSANLPDVLIAPETMSIHMQELIRNAVKAIVDEQGEDEALSGVIQISASLVKPDSIELVVRNNGRKINSTNKNIIFVKRTKIRTNSLEYSHGLGLWGVRRFLRRDGGDIYLANYDESSLTTFVLNLPCQSIHGALT